jgi:hypothetical protein
MKRQLLLLLALAACGKKATTADPSAASGSAPAPAPATATDAAPAPATAPAADAATAAATVTDAPAATALDPDEAKARAGKQAVFTDGKKPEVATEDFMTALARHTIPLDKFVDPTHAIVFASRMPGGADTSQPDILMNECGPKVLGRIEKELASAQAFIDKFPDEQAWSCTNTNGRMCTFAGEGEYGGNYRVYFLDDPARGLRLGGVIETEIGAGPESYEKFVDQARAMIAAPKACK